MPVYRRNVELHVAPALGRIPLRRLRVQQIEAFYDELLHPRDGREGMAPKTVYGIHLVIRGALGEAVRRGILTRNVALVVCAPRLRSIPKVEQEAWTAEELQAFLRAAAGHRLFAPLWLAAFTGMRHNELLGLRWDDLDETRRTLSINRGLIAIGYELDESRGKTAKRPTARRPRRQHRRRAPDLAALATHRAARRRHRAVRADVHRRSRRDHPTPRHLPDFRAHRAPRRREGDPTP
jgi:integrase